MTCVCCRLSRGMPLDAIKSTCFWMASGRWGKPCRHRDVIGRFELETEEQKSMLNKKTWRRIFVVCFFPGLRMFVVQFQCENSTVVYFKHVFGTIVNSDLKE